MASLQHVSLCVSLGHQTQRIACRNGCRRMAAAQCDLSDGRVHCIPRGRHCTALHCTALHCTALHCTALHCTALHCTALLAATCTSLFRDSAIQRTSLLAFQCSAMQCSAVQCSAVQSSAVHSPGCSDRIMQYAVCMALKGPYIGKLSVREHSAY
jgi:hypothetical protein